MPRSDSHAHSKPTPAAADRLGAVALMAAFVLLGVAALRQLWATDLGWQLATGRLVLADGPPQAEALSWTHAGAPWIELRWLWCAAIAALWSGPGPAAISWLAWALHTAAFALVTTARLRRAPLAAAALVLVLAVLAASQRLFARPEAVTGLMVAAFLVVLDSDRRRPGWLVWLLPALQVLWGNAHTLFALGPVLAGLALVAAAIERAIGDPAAPRRLRRAGVLALALTAACVVNPYGLHVFGFAWTLVRELGDPIARDVLAELRSPFALRAGYTAIGFWLALVGTTAVVAVTRVRRLDPFLALTATATLVLAAGSVRNLPLFSLAAIPFVLAALERRDGDAPGRARLVTGAASALALALAAFFTHAIATDRFTVDQHDTNRFGAGVAPQRYPEDAARVAASLRLRDGGTPRTFASLFESSWLLTEHVPSWADPRLEVFGAATFARGVAATKSPAAFLALAGTGPVRVAVSALDDVDFLRTLSAVPGWALVHADAVAAVFADTTAVDARAIAAGEWPALAARVRATLPSPTPRERLAWNARATSAAPRQRFGNALLLLARRADLAEPFLRDAVAAEPRSAAARLAWAEALEGTGRGAEARAQRERAVEIAPDDADALAALALDELIAGDTEAAAPRLEHAVRRAPGHARSWALLGEARARQGRAREAVDCLDRAVRLEPGNAQYRRRLEALSAPAR